MSTPLVCLCHWENYVGQEMAFHLLPFFEHKPNKRIKIQAWNHVVGNNPFDIRKGSYDEEVTYWSSDPKEIKPLPAFTPKETDIGPNTISMLVWEEMIGPPQGEADFQGPPQHAMHTVSIFVKRGHKPAEEKKESRRANR